MSGVYTNPYPKLEVTELCTAVLDGTPIIVRITKKGYYIDMSIPIENVKEVSGCRGLKRIILPEPIKVTNGDTIRALYKDDEGNIIGL